MADRQPHVDPAAHERRPEALPVRLAATGPSASSHLPRSSLDAQDTGTGGGRRQSATNRGSRLQLSAQSQNQLEMLRKIAEPKASNHGKHAGSSAGRPLLFDLLRESRQRAQHSSLTPQSSTSSPASPASPASGHFQESSLQRHSSVEHLRPDAAVTAQPPRTSADSSHLYAGANQQSNQGRNTIPGSKPIMSQVFNATNSALGAMRNSKLHTQSHASQWPGQLPGGSSSSGSMAPSKDGKGSRPPSGHAHASALAHGQHAVASHAQKPRPHTAGKPGENEGKVKSGQMRFSDGYMLMRNKEPESGAGSTQQPEQEKAERQEECGAQQGLSRRKTAPPAEGRRCVSTGGEGEAEGTDGQETPLCANRDGLQLSQSGVPSASAMRQGP